jgi:hypothetical protein
MLTTKYIYITFSIVQTFLYFTIITHYKRVRLMPRSSPAVLKIYRYLVLVRILQEGNMFQLYVIEGIGKLDKLHVLLVPNCVIIVK